MSNKKTKMPVTERALIQRINRKLAADDEVLRTARSERVRLEVGQYYTANVRANCHVRRDTDLEQLGRVGCHSGL